MEIPQVEHAASADIFLSTVIGDIMTKKNPQCITINKITLLYQKYNIDMLIAESVSKIARAFLFLLLSELRRTEQIEVRTDSYINRESWVTTIKQYGGGWGVVSQGTDADVVGKGFCGGECSIVGDDILYYIGLAMKVYWLASYVQIVATERF